MTDARVLVVDDEEAVCWSIRRGLERTGVSVSVAATAEEAIKAAKGSKFDAAILDVRLPGMDGVTAVGKLKAMQPGMRIAVMTAYGDLDTAVRAVEAGAAEYLAKPFELARIREVVKRLLDGPKAEAVAAPEPVAQGEMLGRSAPMLEVFKRIALVAARDSCVLVTGETGTGKELAARAVHRFSARKEKPFVPVHLAAMAPNLIESELFGHVKGAFSGATESRIGVLESADGGTVFLDEIGEIEPAVQVKLLRVIERKELTPVGSTTPRPIDIRLVAATHRNLEEQVAAGSFRRDLYFRLNVFRIEMPALRSRTSDIPLLAEQQLRRLDPKASAIPTATLEYLTQRSWPGNVRELFHAIEHAMIVSQGAALQPHHFPSATDSGEGMSIADREMESWVRNQLANAADDGSHHEKMLFAVERKMLQEALKKNSGNRWRTGRMLGISRATVRKKVEEYRLESSAADDGDSEAE
jgi:two-component system nitrogen regulation response regulator GlnG